MSTTLLLLLSAALIGSGVGLVWRDLNSARRSAIALSLEAESDRKDGRASMFSPSEAPRANLERLGVLLARGSIAGPEHTEAGAAGSSAMIQQWAALQPVI